MLIPLMCGMMEYLSKSQETTFLKYLCAFKKYFAFLYECYKIIYLRDTYKNPINSKILLLSVKYSVLQNS